jgi:hypothetical protein
MKVGESIGIDFSEERNDPDATSDLFLRKIENKVDDIVNLHHYCKNEVLNPKIALKDPSTSSVNGEKQTENKIVDLLDNGTEF